jgi:hypothetical protein
VAALLYVAGFAFRWNYYFNFGVQHLVFNLSFQSTLTASMEMIKKPRNLALTALCLAGTVLIVNVLIEGLRAVARSQRPGRLRKFVGSAARMLGIENALVTDTVLAAAIFYAVYMLSSQMGYWRFKQDVLNSPQNNLPVVTAIIETDSKQELSLACGKEWKEMPKKPDLPNLPNLIGDPKLLRSIQQYHQTCTLNNTVWRLLYRDDKSIYLFASQTDDKVRPLTIILPNTDKVFLVME